MKARSTKWRPALWERVYRGDTIWVEQMYSRDPKWEWNRGDGAGGRAKTRIAAMRAAEKAIDDAIAKLDGLMKSDAPTKRRK